MRLAAVLALCLASAAAAQDCPDGAYPPYYEDAAPFTEALAATEGVAPPEEPITGVTVPHHLAVPDLIAGGLRLAAAGHPARIILLAPDHFGASPAAFATTTHAFDTVLGPVPTDPAAAELIASGASGSCLFAREHGIRAILPFLARLFPGTPVVPVAISASSTREDWDHLAEMLAPLAQDALVVQSTDFSHYLPQHIARQRDQEVLNLLSAGDLNAIAGLVQPDHVDSVGALYVQTQLQAGRGAVPVVVANRNLQDGTDRFIAETTSYMVILYLPQDTPALPPPLPAGSVYLLAGDLFLGRAWPGLLQDELVARRVEQAVLAQTRGLPLIANLEGVILPRLPGTLAHMTLAMPAELLADWARRLNLIAVGLANNHAGDIGVSGLAETRAALDAAGLAHAGQGERIDLPDVSIVALTDLDPRADPPMGVLDDRLLDAALIPDATRPVVALMHWGREWVTAPGDRESDIARALAARGVAAIVGAHPHAASGAPVAQAGGATLVIQSLGNFLFDQSGHADPKSPSGGRASGALAEVRTFPQGTVFTRRIDLPVLFDIAREP